MIDLHAAMHDAARSGTVHRPAMAAAPVLARIRRRRTARVAVESTVGVAAAGAVAFGGAQLAGLRTVEPPPPATSDPAPGIDAGCGTTVAQLAAHAGDPAVRIDAALDRSVIAGDALEVTVRTTVHPRAGFDEHVTQGLGLVATRDGVVVGVPAPLGPTGDPATTVEPDGRTSVVHTFAPTFRSCAPGADAEPGDLLAAGEYELYAVVQNLAAGLSTPPPSYVGGPWDFSVEGPADDQQDRPDGSTETDGSAPPSLDELVISLAGLGPLPIGSTVPSDARQADLLRWDPEYCAGAEVPGRWLANYDDVIDDDGTHWQPFSVAVFEDHVMRINVQVAGPHTAVGIGVGSTLAELQAAYPQLERLRSAAETGIPIDAWGLRDGEATLVFEVSADADTPEPYWQQDERDRVVAVVLVQGIPYGQESWFSEQCG